MNDYDVRLKSNGAYWQAWWYDPRAKGRKGVKSLGAKVNLSKRQAQARCRDLALELRKGAARGAGNVPRLSAWLARYLEIRTDLSDSTRVLVEHTGRTLAAFFDNDPTIDAITRSDAAEWRAALARGDLRKANKFPKSDADAAKSTKWRAYRKKLAAKAPKPLTEDTVCKHVRCAKRMFEEAADDEGLGLIQRNPFKRLKGKPASPRKDWAQVTAPDLERIREACPDEAWRLLFTLCRLAGLRRGEAVRLRWRDIQWAGNRIIVNADIPKANTKKKRRVIPIEPARCPTGLTAMLEAALAAAPDGAVHVLEGGNFENFDRDAKAIVARAGLAVYSKPFHTLRKNREGELAREYPQHVLKEWQGHDPEVADEHYLRVDEDLYAAPGDRQAQIVPK